MIVAVILAAIIMAAWLAGLLAFIGLLLESLDRNPVGGIIFTWIFKSIVTSLIALILIWVMLYIPCPLTDTIISWSFLNFRFFFWGFFSLVLIEIFMLLVIPGLVQESLRSWIFETLVKKEGDSRYVYETAEESSWDVYTWCMCTSILYIMMTITTLIIGTLFMPF